MESKPISVPAPQKFIAPSLPLYYCPWPVPFNPSMVMPMPMPQPPLSDQAQQSQVRKYKRTWSREQIEELYTEAKVYCTEHSKDLNRLDIADFMEIGKAVCRSPRKCMNKMMEIQVSGTLRSGVWGADEDLLLKQMLVEGKKKWGVIANAINEAFHKGLKVRTGKQCKERWNNHINPLIDRGDWTTADDLKLLESHKHFGNRWSVIAKELKNRTDSSIKNRIKSLLNRERQNVLGSKESDLIESLICRKRQELAAENDQEPASPASRVRPSPGEKGGFSSVVDKLQGFDLRPVPDE